MLGSITPLGERGRGSTWWVTVTAYVVGSTLGATTLGAALGGIGAGVVPGPTAGARLALLGSILVLGLVLDGGAFGLRLPSIHRQVDEASRDLVRAPERFAACIRGEFQLRQIEVHVDVQQRDAVLVEELAHQRAPCERRRPLSRREVHLAPESLAQQRLGNGP